MKKILPIIIILALLLAGCGAYTPIKPAAPEESAEPFLFTEDNYPAVDGSTPMAPLAEAAASVLLGKGADVTSRCFGGTDDAYLALLSGAAELVIAPEPGESALLELKAADFETESAAICADALVFIVNADNPVDSLTLEQLRGIYSGSITNWKQLGGNDAEITAFQRMEDSGSHGALLRLVMNGAAVAEAPEELIVADGETLSAVKNFDGSAGAITYGSYFYAEDMQMASGYKLLAVEGVTLDAGAIASGEYPLTLPVLAVISADEAEDSPARILWQWLQGSEGRRLLTGCGYVIAED